MIALLLIAGQSKRFWPLQDKSLTMIAGETLLEHQVDRLKAGGIREVILVGGKHNLKQVKVILPHLQTVEQKDLTLGMRGALLSALPKLGDESILIVSGNDVIDPIAYQSLKERLKTSDADGVILARKTNHYFPGGYLTLKGKRILSIVEKPGEGKEPSKYVNIVAHAHRSAKTLLKALREVKPTKDEGYELALDQLFNQGTYEALLYRGGWQAVKYPWHLIPLLERLLSEIRESSIDRTAQIHPSAVIQGSVVLGKGVRIMPNACIVGPCVIGEGTIIANNCLIRQSSIGKYCVIGYTTEVKCSIVADHVWTHMSYLGESIVGSNTALGGGTLIGNLRLDEAEISSAVGREMVATGLTKFGAIIGQDCRVGIRASLMPGVKVGAGSFVSSAVVVAKDIPNSSFVKMVKGDMHVRPNRTTTPSPAGRMSYRKKM